MSQIIKKQLPFGYFSVFNSEPPTKVVFLNQVHGKNLFTIPNSKIGAKQLDGDFDGFLFDDKLTSSLAIKTADCLPIFIWGENGMSFLHAGWKGLAAGILTSEAIKKISPKYAFIGPHIKACHFEVRPDFKNNFKNSPYFSTRNEKIFFDLKAQAISDLTSMNPQIKVEDSMLCTHCINELNSFRQTATPNRNWNVWSPSLAL